MERKTAAGFDPELLVLFDAYVHGALDRRGFLDRAGKFAVAQHGFNNDTTPRFDEKSAALA